jgi:hypothetical protein
MPKWAWRHYVGVKTDQSVDCGAASEAWCFQIVSHITGQMYLRNKTPFPTPDFSGAGG